MTSHDKRQRSPDIKALGLAVFAGVMLAQAEKMDGRWRLALAAAAVGCYVVGVNWE